MSSTALFPLYFIWEANSLFTYHLAHYLLTQKRLNLKTSVNVSLLDSKLFPLFSWEHLYLVREEEQRREIMERWIETFNFKGQKFDIDCSVLLSSSTVLCTPSQISQHGTSSSHVFWHNGAGLWDKKSEVGDYQHFTFFSTIDNVLLFCIPHVWFNGAG